MSLDPQIAEVLERAARSPLPSPWSVPVEVARRLYRDSRAALAPRAPEVAKSWLLLADGPAGPVPVRGYRPAGSAAGEPLPALVFFHGGGWAIGDLDTHDVLCRELSNGARCAVFSVEYRLAPEHRFPAAVEDCFAATRWVAARAAELGCDAARLAVGGDSAGGNLAAVVALLARDAGAPRIRRQLLIYPATDMRAGHPSHQRNGTGYLLTREAIRSSRERYLPRGDDALDWRASPLLAPSLAGLPGALVLTAGYDPLVDEGRAYAERLAQEGGEVEYREYADMVHGFILMGGVVARANAAVAECCASLRRAFEAVPA